MATHVILPALGMVQETGKILRWLKNEGEMVTRGEPLLEIETDKATVEIEAPANGILSRITATIGDDIPVGQIIAAILSPEEAAEDSIMPQNAQNLKQGLPRHQADPPTDTPDSTPIGIPGSRPALAVSPLASRIAAEHHLDLQQVKPAGRRIQKADVLTYLQKQQLTAEQPAATRSILASPKARRLARELGKDIATIQGTGPQGAVIAGDILRAITTTPVASLEPEAAPVITSNGTHELTLSATWKTMAERTTQSWTSIPHFYLTREINASRLLAWHAHIAQRATEHITYTDLLVKIVATALRLHPQINASWHDGELLLHSEIHIGLAVAVEAGLVVPVIRQADRLGPAEIARQRQELLSRAQAGKLRLQDIRDGTFTISNLGMYNVDAFNAIINPPQAAILAVGRIAERVVALNGEPAIQPMMIVTLSCDHRVIDGVRGARFLSSVAELIEEPLGLLDGTS